MVVIVCGALAAIVALTGVVESAVAQAGFAVSLRPVNLLVQMEEPSQLLLTLQAPAGPGPAELVFTLKGPGKITEDIEAWPLVGTWKETAETAPGGEVAQTYVVPKGLVTAPGAYRVEVEAAAAGTETGATTLAGTWLGVVPREQAGIDLALIWLLASGPRRDVDGVFVDDTVQAGLSNGGPEQGGLYSVLDLAGDFPAWRMTVAVEPLYLTQIADLSDGFAKIADDGTRVEVGSDAETPRRAALALEGLRAVAARDTMQFIPGPYATPYLALLSNEGWDDGLDQMRVGKAEFQRLLGANQTTQAAFSPGFDITTNSIKDFSQASVTYVPVLSYVLKDMAEEPDSYLLPARVIDDANNRVTLIPTDSQLRAALTAPWEPERFFAALASDLAAGKEGPFVASPPSEYEVPPNMFLQEIGRGLSQFAWIRTATLSDVVEDYTPGSRPIFISRYGGYVEGMLGRALLAELREGHATVDDLAQAVEGAGSSAPALDEARLLLYQAQSLYWFRPETDPAEVNRAITFVRKAADLAQAELAKVTIASDLRMERDARNPGARGSIILQVKNAAGYSLHVQVFVSGDVSALDGDVLEAVIRPGDNELTVPVVATTTGGTASVRVASGDSILGVVHVSFSSFGWGGLWAGVGLAAALVVVVALGWRRRARKRSALGSRP